MVFVIVQNNQQKRFTCVPLCGLLRFSNVVRCYSFFGYKCHVSECFRTVCFGWWCGGRRLNSTVKLITVQNLSRMCILSSPDQNFHDLLSKNVVLVCFSFLFVRSYRRNEIYPRNERRGMFVSLRVLWLVNYELCEKRPRLLAVSVERLPSKNADVDVAAQSYYPNVKSWSPIELSVVGTPWSTAERFFL